MEPVSIGRLYDKIADWWYQYHHASDYGLAAIKKAIAFHPGIKTALDVGCGAGGRLIHALVAKGSAVHGIDISERMIQIARENHPNETFEVQDICSWQIKAKYDFIYAWDSIFHIPLEAHASVIKKLCKALKPEGILLYTCGNEQGEHTDQWINDTFYYSSIGINQNLQLLMASGLSILHLELDQYPEKHVVVIGKSSVARS